VPISAAITTGVVLAGASAALVMLGKGVSV